MRPDYRIALAAPDDVPALAAIELAAATLLRGWAPESVLNESTDPAHFHAAREAGLLWVVRAGGEPVGFAHVEMLAPDAPHLEEVDVHPAHGRRGVGAALVRAVCDWTARSGHAGVTLTTFRAVSWNMPFYARLGFEELPPSAWSPALAAVVADETARGLDPALRLVMRWRPPAA